MALTPEERAAYLASLGWPSDVQWLPLPDEINETNLLDQVKRIAACVWCINDLPKGG